MRHHLVLGPIALSECIAGLGTGIIGSVAIVHVTKTLGYDTGPQGVVYAIGGVGSLVAAALAPRVLARFGLWRSMVVALVVMVPAMSLMAWAPRPSVLGYAMLVGQQLLADPVGTVSIVAFGTVIAAGAPRRCVAASSRPSRCWRRSAWPPASSSAVCSASHRDSERRRPCSSVP